MLHLTMALTGSWNLQCKKIESGGVYNNSYLPNHGEAISGVTSVPADNVTLTDPKNQREKRLEREKRTPK